MRNTKGRTKSKFIEPSNSRESVFESVRKKKLLQPVVVVDPASAKTPTVIKKFRVPHMTTLASCRRVQRNILRMVARDELSSRKALVMNRIVNSITAVTTITTAEQENAALRAAFERAISVGHVSRDSLPLLFQGTALSEENFTAYHK